MPLNAYEVSVTLFVRGLTNLKTLLKKGEAHASANAIEPSELLDAKLAEDMYNLATQAHWAGEGAKLAVARLLGEVKTPVMEAPKSFTELYQQIDATIAYLKTLEPQALDAGLEQEIELRHRGESLRLAGSRFLLEFAIPNFFFHIDTAYGILRQQGVPITKGDLTGMAFG